MTEETPDQHALGRHYVLATDGACKGNPGAGGWSAIIQLKEGPNVLRQRCIAGQELMTTNNRMELLAPLRGLARLKEAIPAIVISDSNYLVRGMTEWLEPWKANAWRSAGGIIKNRDLWEELDAHRGARPALRWLKVKGHAGQELNEAADKLASNAALGSYPAGETSIKRMHPTWFK